MPNKKIIKYCEYCNQDVCIEVKRSLIHSGNKSDEWLFDFFCDQKYCNKQRHCIHTLTRKYDKDTTTLSEIYKNIKNDAY